MNEEYEETILRMTNSRHELRSKVMETSASASSCNQTFLIQRITKTGGSQHYFIGQGMGRFVIFYCRLTFSVYCYSLTPIGQICEYFFPIGQM